MESNITTIKTEGEAARGRELVDLSDIGAVKRKYSEVYEIDVVVDEDDESEGRKLAYYFHKPTTASFNRYLKTAGKNMAASTTAFVMDNIIEEQHDALSAECENYPGLALNLGQKLLSVVGLGDNVNFRKR